MDTSINFIELDNDSLETFHMLHRSDSTIELFSPKLKHIGLFSTKHEAISKWQSINPSRLPLVEQSIEGVVLSKIRMPLRRIERSDT